MTDAVPFVLVDKIRSENGQKPGAVEMRELGGSVRGFAFRCPCGCGCESYLPIAGPDKSEGWVWDGNRDRPTLTPSILQSGLPCKWHGYLTDGEFRQC